MLAAFNLNIEIVAPECIIPEATLSLKFYVSLAIPALIGTVLLLV